MMRGQSSIEFLAFVSLSALLLAVMYGIVAEKQVDLSQNVISSQASRIAEEAGFQVEMAQVQGEGYLRNFSLDSEIAGRPYEVAIGRGSVLVNHSEGSTAGSTLYEGGWINVSTSKTNRFAVNNNGSINVFER